jgi:hypothetical protein
MYTYVHAFTLGAPINNSHREPETEPGDTIYAALAKENRLAEQLANTGTGRGRGRGGRGRRGGRVERVLIRPPLPLAELRTYKRGGDAIAETNRLFERYGERRDDPAWQSPEGEKFSKYKQRAAVSTLHKLQSQLIHHITERSAELELLHRRLGQEAAKVFLNGVKQRSKALDNLVQEYNQVARVAGVRTLDAGRLRENGLDNEDM